MAKTTINIKADVAIKRKAQKTARDLGLPLSTIINAYLSQFVRTKSVHFYIPEGELKSSVKRRLDRLTKETRAGMNLSPAFTSTQEMDVYLDSLEA